MKDRISYANSLVCYSSIYGFLFIVLTLSTPQVALSQQVDICRFQGASYEIKSVDINAIPAQVANGAIPLFDADGDGFYPDNNCGVGPMGDCNDYDDTVYPGAPNPSTIYDANCVVLSYMDNDGDGFTSDVDCDDNNNAIYPGASEICNDGLDNDCDGMADCLDGDCDYEDNCISCTLFGIDILDRIIPTTLSIGVPSYYKEDCTSSGTRRQVLSITTVDGSSGTDIAYQMRFTIIQYSDEIYSLQYNGEFVNTVGVLETYIPGVRKDQDSDPMILDCMDILKAYAIKLSLPLFCY